MFLQVGLRSIMKRCTKLISKHWRLKVSIKIVRYLLDTQSGANHQNIFKHIRKIVTPNEDKGYLLLASSGGLLGTFSWNFQYFLKNRRQSSWGFKLIQNLFCPKVWEMDLLPGLSAFPEIINLSWTMDLLRLHNLSIH